MSASNTDNMEKNSQSNSDENKWEEMTYNLISGFPAVILVIVSYIVIALLTTAPMSGGWSLSLALIWGVTVSIFPPIVNRYISPMIRPSIKNHIQNQTSLFDN